MTTYPHSPTAAGNEGACRRPFRLDLLAAATLAALSSLAGTVQAQVVHDYRGADGSCCHDHNGSDGGNGADFVGASDSSLNVSVGAGTAVFVDVSGGHGGDSEGSTDPGDTNYNHWGGNGGEGATLGYNLLDSTLRSGGAGLRAASHGGDGGRWAMQSGGGATARAETATTRAWWSRAPASRPGPMAYGSIPWAARARNPRSATSCRPAIPGAAAMRARPA
ncbi:hypothetical protein GCM10009097_45600 [Pigmentiphaga daeguensis]|uniref:Uncharacterized protein n=1 Tax=Pigmentiphaga daeguensis TaxID=414049 RepID=A0ABN1CP27_9BURK